MLGESGNIKGNIQEYPVQGSRNIRSTSRTIRESRQEKTPGKNQRSEGLGRCAGRVCAKRGSLPTRIIGSLFVFIVFVGHNRKIGFQLEHANAFPLLPTDHFIPASSRKCPPCAFALLQAANCDNATPFVGIRSSHDPPRFYRYRATRIWPSDAATIHKHIL